MRDRSDRPGAGEIAPPADAQVRPRILVVDDDAERAAIVARALSAVGDCEAAHTVDDALRRIAGRRWDAAVVDFVLGESGTGFLVLQGLTLVSPRTARILYSSYLDNSGLAQEAARTARAQATVYAKRDDFLAELCRTVASLLDRDGSASAALPSESDIDGEWAARSDVIREMLEALRQAAEADAVVFLHGEAGAGKHLAAATLRTFRRERGLAPDPRGAGEGRPLRTVRVPPLRERLEDLPGLCEQLLAEQSRVDGLPVARVTPAALEALARRQWWGNVRELSSVLVRARSRARASTVVEAGELPTDIVPPDSASHLEKDEHVKQQQLLYLRMAGSVSGAARLGGLTPANFRRLMARHGILRADTFDGGE